MSLFVSDRLTGLQIKLPVSITSVSEQIQHRTQPFVLQWAVLSLSPSNDEEITFVRFSNIFLRGPNRSIIRYPSHTPDSNNIIIAACCHTSSTTAVHTVSWKEQQHYKYLVPFECKIMKFYIGHYVKKVMRTRKSKKSISRTLRTTERVRIQ